MRMSDDDRVIVSAGGWNGERNMIKKGKEI